jgi:hypothetical protein
MKRILLIIVFSGLALFSRSQVAINKKYSDVPAEQDETRVKLIYFIGDINEDRVLLKWNVAENEAVNLFEVNKSYDGKNFNTSAFILGSEKKGNETYFFPEILKEGQKIYYRLKIIGNNKKVKYSKVISVQPSFLEKNSVAISNHIDNSSITK